MTCGKRWLASTPSTPKGKVYILNPFPCCCSLITSCIQLLPGLSYHPSFVLENLVVPMHVQWPLLLLLSSYSALVHLIACVLDIAEDAETVWERPKGRPDPLRTCVPEGRQLR